MTTRHQGESRSAQGDRERFAGWGVIGLSFDSGHALGLRRFPESSIGPGYTSVWHRSPRGEWSFWSTVAAELSCARYAGGRAVDTGEAAIELTWPTPDRLAVNVDAPALSWDARIASTPMTRALGALAPEQAMLGDFCIPQRGLLAVATLELDPRPTRLPGG